MAKGIDTGKMIYPNLVLVRDPHNSRDVHGTLADCGEFRRLNPELHTAWDAKRFTGLDVVTDAPLIAYDRERTRLSRRAARACE